MRRANHGIHAEPTTFGIKLTGFAFEADRNVHRLERAFAQTAVGAISGAVHLLGDLAGVRATGARPRLGLEREPVSTQVVARRHLGHPSLRIAQAREALKISLDYGKQFKRLGDRLARQKIAERKVLAVARELWPADQGTDRQIANAHARREAVLRLFLGPTVGNAPGSKWCAANAFIEQIEWGTTAHGAEGRLLRHFDDPAGLKHRALELVTLA